MKDSFGLEVEVEDYVLYPDVDGVKRGFQPSIALGRVDHIYREFATIIPMVGASKPTIFYGGQIVVIAEEWVPKTFRL